MTEATNAVVNDGDFVYALSMAATVDGVTAPAVRLETKPENGPLAAVTIPVSDIDNEEAVAQSLEDGKKALGNFLAQAGRTK